MIVKIDLQYDLFDEKEKREIRAMERVLAEVIEKQEKLRKSLYCRHQHLNGKVEEMEDRIKIMERGLCQKRQK